MARGRHYAKLSLSNAARLSFSDLCILLFMFLSLCRLCVCVFLCSHWSLVDVPLIFFCPADHVPDWQPRVLLGMVEARSVNVKKTTTTTTVNSISEGWEGEGVCCQIVLHFFSPVVQQTTSGIGHLSKYNSFFGFATITLNVRNNEVCICSL